MISSLLLLLATPYLISEVIDVGLSSGQISILLFLGGLLILASVFRGAASYMQTYIAESLAQRITYRLRRQLQERVQSLSFAYHDKSQTGNLMSPWDHRHRSNSLLHQYGQPALGLQHPLAICRVRLAAGGELASRAGRLFRIALGRISHRPCRESPASYLALDPARHGGTRHNPSRKISPALGS